MNKDKIKEIIKDWQFATCPCDTEDPFFWKWNEHGLEMLATYISGLLLRQREDILEGLKHIAMVDNGEEPKYFVKDVLELLK